MKALDTEHQFRGYHSDGGVCRVEIYLTDDGRPPLIVVTELKKNQNTSVTNLAEYLAAEVMERYLISEQMEGHDPPFIWVEMYERDREDRRFGMTEDWSIVTFEHYRREQTQLNARPPAWRYKIGHADWTHLPRAEFEALVQAYGGVAGAPA